MAARLLDGAAATSAELARLLPVGERWPTPAGARHPVAETVDEADVQRALGLLEELDTDLDRIARGGSAARAPLLADSLRAGIDALVAAVASGRIRPRGASTEAGAHRAEGRFGGRANRPGRAAVRLPQWA